MMDAVNATVVLLGEIYGGSLADGYEPTNKMATHTRPSVAEESRLFKWKHT